MSISKPFTFTAGTKARANEVNTDFDILYSQVNTNISDIAQINRDVGELELNKAEVNGSSTQRFAVADAVSPADAVNKQSLTKSITNILDYISGLTIEKDTNSPNDTILVNPGSCYDNAKEIVLVLNDITSKQNLNQGANTTYYVYIIGSATGSSIDILISSSSVEPTLPTGYTRFRNIGNYTTDNNGYINNIYSFGVNTLNPQAQSVIVETYKNGNSWYRIWSKDSTGKQWCEQGGLMYSANTVTFIKPFADTTYTISVTALNPRESCDGCTVYSKTATTFHCEVAGHGGSHWQDAGTAVSWQANGYLA